MFDTARTNITRTLRKAVMIAPDEGRQVAGQIEFPQAAPEDTKVRPKAAFARLDQNAAGAPLEINLSGAQILAGFAGALSFVAIMMWTLIRLWLFEQ
jgi:hypothetical protein